MTLTHSCPDPSDNTWSDGHQEQLSNLADSLDWGVAKHQSKELIPAGKVLHIVIPLYLLTIRLNLSSFKNWTN